MLGRQICFFFFLFLLFHLSSTPYFLPADAANEFSVAYDVTYEIQANGLAKVVLDVALTNQFSNIYATEYNLTFEKGELSGIGAWDSLGKVPIQVEKESGQTKVKLKFNDQVVGVGKTLRFTLKYELAEVAKKKGQIWQVILPKQSNLETLADYRLVLKVPRDFPPLSSVLPIPPSQQTTKQFQEFIFNKEQLKQEGIVAVFGQAQVFDFQLTYHLENPDSNPVYTKIALPPNTNYQQVIYSQIEPLPEDVEIDDDGNWLALYNLFPKENKVVVAKGQAQILTNPIVKASFDDHYLTKLLAPQPYWEVDDPQIQQLAGRLKTPAAIYNYVADSLDYDFERVKSDQGRMGAKKTLSDPSRALCMEFTDLFVALARAAGIPAREINGFAYTDNPKLKPLSESADILHSWPEYWDFENKTWRPVDPTWQATSGLDYFSQPDLFHFAFVIHGLDSQYPAAAGSYKGGEENRQKDVEVKFGIFEGEKESVLKVNFVLPQSYLIERGTRGYALLINYGPSAYYQLPLEFVTDGINLASLQKTVIERLPPFGKELIPIEITADWNWKNLGQKKLTLLVNNQEFVYNLRRQSLLLYLVLPMFGGILVGILTVYLILKMRK